MYGHQTPPDTICIGALASILFLFSSNIFQCANPKRKQPINNLNSSRFSEWTSNRFLMHEPWTSRKNYPAGECLPLYGVKPSDLVEKCTTFLQHFKIRIQHPYSPNQTATNPTSLRLAYRPLCIFSPDVAPWKACSTVKLKHATHFSKQAPRRVLTVDMSSHTNIASKHIETATQSYHAHARCSYCQRQVQLAPM